jgi:hypothetical protein
LKHSEWNFFSNATKKLVAGFWHSAHMDGFFRDSAGIFFFSTALPATGIFT